jgi:hypothetical protein
MPYITDDAIKTFNKAAPEDLSFNIDLLAATLTGIQAEGLTSSYYTYAGGTLTVDWNYLINRSNGILEIKFTTSKNVVSVWVDITGAVSLFTVGSGAAADPYMIYTVDQMKELSGKAAAGNKFAGINFKLAKDVDFGGQTITPIADFKGTFNGAGYAVKNFVVNSLSIDGNAGLFAINNGTIKNLTADGKVQINGQRTVYAGAVAGVNNGTIDQCVALGEIKVECNTGNFNSTTFLVGGAVGKNFGTVIGVTAENTIEVTSSSYNPFTRSYIGGIAGFNEGGTVTGCAADLNNLNKDIPWYNGCSINVIANS